jgi:hypothetical protein
MRPGDLLWLVDSVEAGSGAAAQSLAGIRRVVQECLKAGCAGFEVAYPALPARPDLRGLAPWGRLGYDAKATDAVLKQEALGL